MSDEIQTCPCQTIRLETRFESDLVTFQVWVCKMCGREFIPRADFEKIGALISDAEEDLHKAQKAADDIIEVAAELYRKAVL